jgi:hypothetical protein
MTAQLLITKPLDPKFMLGQLVATPNALEHVSHREILCALGRHASGDWGEVCAEDKETNNLAVKAGIRILSAYMSQSGTKFWIITEADRSATTVLLPEDY